MLSFCFEAFSLKFTEKFLFNQKMTISESSMEKIRKFVFLNKFEKDQIQRKNWICCKQPFLFKAVKWDKYKQKLFFSSKLDTYRQTMFSGCFEAFSG